MANRDHQHVEIQRGDTVVVSATPIPGNENGLAHDRQPVQGRRERLLPHDEAAHVSGHAGQEELKLMLGLTKPSTASDARRIPDAVPARTAGEPDRGRAGDVFIIENGTPIEFSACSTAAHVAPHR